MMDGGTGTAEIKASTGVHKINALVQTVDTQLDVTATGAGTVLKTNGGIDNTAGVALNLTQELGASLTVYGVTNNGAMTVTRHGGGRRDQRHGHDLGRERRKPVGQLDRAEHA